MKTQRFARAGFLFLALLLSLALTVGRPALPAPAAGPENAASLPAGSQAPISALIGAGQVAYHARQSVNGFTVGNPAHNLSAEFAASGVSYTTGAYSWDLSLLGYGYGDALQPVPLVAPSANNNRIEYSRGPLSEWYLNGPFGLEQGFTLDRPPARNPTAGPLTLSLALGGDLQAAVDNSVQGLVLSDPGGAEVLRYSGLSAFDSAGRDLPAKLELSGKTLLLLVNDQGASYPLTIDPFVQKAKLTASHKAAEDFFGHSMSISGDVVVVGAYGADPGGTTDAGIAYVFVKPGGGWANMTQTAKLTASDKAAGDYFGWSVSISGDVVVVGANKNDPDSTTDAGAAYVFVKPGGGWADMTQTAKLTASDKAEYDYFGYCVSTIGDVIVVGASLADPGGTSGAGAAYVFVKPGGGWADMTQTARLTASDKAEDDGFGGSVSISGDVIVVGASWASPGETNEAGAAYIFVKPGGGWADMTQTAKLTASDKAAGDWFGRSVSINEDVVVIGAPLADPGGTGDAGAVYIFVKPGGGWSGNLTETAKLTASDKADSDWFGSSVAISGDAVVVGAPYYATGGMGDTGTAYLFIKPGGGWSDMNQTARLIAADLAGGEELGWSISISGDDVVVGAPSADPGGIDAAGAAYVFFNCDSTTTTITSDSPDPSLAGGTVNVSVTVSGGSTTPSGTIKITGANTNCNISLSGGSGNCNVTFDTVGAKTLTATYKGDATHAGSSDTESHQVNPLTSKFYSVGAYDGWILESSDTNNPGGSVNASDTTIRLGDDASDRQYRSILSFNTASLPDTAVITSIVLKIKKQGLVGTDPFTTHLGLLVDICKPYFGTTLGLTASDFQALASKGSVGIFGTTPSAGWYTVTLSSTARPYINKTGTTQFRLRFQKGDNDDMGADYLKFYSGNAGTASRPVLIIQYYIPLLASFS